MISCGRRRFGLVMEMVRRRRCLLLLVVVLREAHPFPLLLQEAAEVRSGLCLVVGLRVVRQCRLCSSCAVGSARARPGGVACWELSFWGSGERYKGELCALRRCHSSGGGSMWNVSGRWSAARIAGGRRVISHTTPPPNRWLGSSIRIGGRCPEKTAVRRGRVVPSPSRGKLQGIHIRRPAEVALVALEAQNKQAVGRLMPIRDFNAAQKRGDGGWSADALSLHSSCLQARHPKEERG
jgi:hypothetical protein